MNRYFLFFILISLYSCFSNNENAIHVKPAALGVINEIVVVCDDEIWDGSVGDSIRSYFEGIYPLTPQPESLFDLRHFSMRDLEAQPLRKRLRTYLILGDLNDDRSLTTKFIKRDLGKKDVDKLMDKDGFYSSFGKDKWATGQILIYLYANGLNNLGRSISDKFNTISSKVRIHDETQLYQMTYPRGEGRSNSNKLKEVTNLQIDIPIGFKVAKEEENFIWLRKDVGRATMSILAQKLDYVDETQLNKEMMKKVVNELGKLHVSSQSEDSYLVLNDEDLPILEYDQQNGEKYVKEFRGIWEMENDFMGGPYITYLIPNDRSLVCVFAFILAPGEDKREMLQQFEKIMSSIK